MKRLLISAAILLLSPLAAPGDEKAPELSGDLAKIQGKWSAKFGPGDGFALLFTFKGNAVNVHVTTPDGEQIEVTGEFRLDESVKPHKAIDWLKFSTDGGDALPDRLGIYVFEDVDTLKTCSAGGENPRPAAFLSGEGGAVNIVLKREKDDGKTPCETPACAEPKDPDPDKDAPKGDLAKLQGTWTAKVGPEKNISIAIAFKGNAVILKISPPEGQEFTAPGEAKIDETAKPHKTVDWMKFTNPNGDEVPSNLGLYEFVDADTLRLCSGGPGNPRPTEFKAGDGGPPNLVVLKRAPADPK